MKRVLKISALVTLLSTLILAIALLVTMAWLVRSEQGSRWLLDKGLAIAPLSIEASGISGTLAEGLGVDSLTIALPVVEIRARQIVVSWTPASLLAGVVDINSARIAELDIDILEAESAGEPVDDLLFWLKIPLHIYIKSGQLDKLRIEQAEFTDIKVTGTIGHGRLDVDSLDGSVAGIELQASGELTGPAPGRLQALARWKMPEQSIDGSGSFSGNIEALGFTHIINVPEAVNFTGTIYDLFSHPSLEGRADWPSVRIPGETVLYSKAGDFKVNSDFRSAHLDGTTNVLLEAWPQAAAQINALVDLQGITIDAYTLEALDGSITGSGRIDYADGLRGQMAINAAQINTGLINSDLPGRLDFDAALLIDSVDTFSIDVTAANARIAGKDLNGVGQIHWHDAKLSAIDASINAGTNRLTADVKLGKQLSGAIIANAPELAMLWPELQGRLEASVTLDGSIESPQARVTANAASVSYASHSLETLNLNGELKHNKRLTATLTANGLRSAEQQLGNLAYTLAGTLAEHRSTLDLKDGVVALELRTTGGWNGEQYVQRFKYGEIQPDGFDSWQLEQDPELRITTAGVGQVGAHCWKQQQASICVTDSNWDQNSLKSAVNIDDFALATLRPLLAQGYSIDGNVDADIRLSRNNEGLQGELHWRQYGTILSYADDFDEFRTELDDVRIYLFSDDNQTKLDASLTGEQGLNMKASARVTGPLEPESTLQASARGRLPNIGLLRPLLRRVVNPGELKGELTVNLNAGGALGDPVFTGGANLADASLGLLGAGVTLRDINIAAQSQGTDQLQLKGTLRSGDGSAEILGDIHVTDDADLEADIRIRGQNLATVRVPDLSVNTSPDLKLTISEGVFDISGKMLIPHASATIRTLPQTAVSRSADVVIHTPERADEPDQATIVTGDVVVLLGDDVSFSGFGLTSRLEGGLRLRQILGGDLRTSGTVRVRDGFLTGYGRELRVDRGELTFTGPLDDPLINIQVSRESVYEGRQYTIGLRLTGSAQNVRTEPFSRPAMSEHNVLSFLLLDRPASSDSDASGAALALGLQQLFPDQGGRFGLDEVSFETNDANEAAMVAGKRINDKLHVRYVFGSLGSPGSFRIRYLLGHGFSLEASTGNRQSMDLIYLLER